MQSIVLQKTDVEMPKLITLSHEFLRSFCRNNRENQIRLHAFITTDADESTKEGMFQVLVKYIFPNFNNISKFKSIKFQQKCLFFI